MGMKRHKNVVRLKGKPKSRTAAGEKPNWSELPRDVTVSILSRLGAVEIFRSAQMVCVTWRNICKDPLMWRTIDMRNDGDINDNLYGSMCRRAVDRSCGNLADINIYDFGSDYLLNYITNRCCGIRRLRLVCCYNISDGGLSEAVSKLSLLEELEISLCDLSRKSVEAVGLCCPLLKSFKLNSHWFKLSDYNDVFDDEYDEDDGGSELDPSTKDDEAIAIARTMHGLHHLQLFGNQLTNDGLREILDSCPHLESLDVRYCFNLDLRGDLGRRCAERVKRLWLPNDSILDYEFRAAAYAGDSSSEDFDGGGYGYYSDNSDFHDDFTKIRYVDFLF